MKHFVLAALLTFGVSAHAQAQQTATVAAGSQFTVVADHDGQATSGYRLYQDGTARNVIDVPVSRLIGGSVAFPFPGGAPAGTYTFKVSAYLSDGSWVNVGPAQPVAGTPAPVVTDGFGAVWSLGGSGETLRNGVWLGGGFGMTYVTAAGTTYTFAGDGNWWKFIDTSAEAVSAEFLTLTVTGSATKPTAPRTLRITQP